MADDTLPTLLMSDGFGKEMITNFSGSIFKLYLQQQASLLNQN